MRRRSLLGSLLLFPAVSTGSQTREQTPQSVSPIPKRGILNQWWTTQPHYELNLGTTDVPTGPVQIQSDGTDIWVTSSLNPDGLLSRVRASDGKLLQQWTGAFGAYAILIAMGRVFTTRGFTNPGGLYMLDPRQPVGPVTVVSHSVGNQPIAIAFDGSRIWTANLGGSISIITPTQNLPWQVETISNGFGVPYGILFDGIDIWVADNDGWFLRLVRDGTITQRVRLGPTPRSPIFDGVKIWTPDISQSLLYVVDRTNGRIITKLKGNGLDQPTGATFDGERILVTNQNGNSVSLWNASSLAPLGSYSTGTGSAPFHACSDGIGFWVSLSGVNKIGRF